MSFEGKMGDTTGFPPGAIIYTGSRDELCAKLRMRDDRITELEAALREARGMLRSCGLDEPDDEFQALWDRGLAKIDAALQRATS